MTCAGLFALVVGYGALSRVGRDRGGFLRKFKFLSKSVVARLVLTASTALPVADESTRVPTPLDGDRQYRYQDLSDPYFRRVKEDPRLRLLFEDTSATFQSMVVMMDFLRAQFPHRVVLIDEDDPKLLELLNRVERGERSRSGAMSAMLVQLGQARGVHGRRVFLKGHVVAEIWIPELENWIVFDPLFNLYYVDERGVRLSPLEIHRKLISVGPDGIFARPGKSENTLYTEAYGDKLLSL